MRVGIQVLRALLAGAVVSLGVSACGKPMPPNSSGPGALPDPHFEVLQAGRMLHYLIDKKEVGGNTLKADVSLYQSGRVAITGDLTSAGANPTAVIKLRLTNREQETLWQTEITPMFCEGNSCSRETRHQVWNYEIGPRLAARVANVWMTLDIIE